MIWSNILLQQKYLIAYTGLVSVSSAGSWPYIFSLQLLFVNNTLYFSISSKTFIISKCLNLFFLSSVWNKHCSRIFQFVTTKIEMFPDRPYDCISLFWDGGCWFFCVSHLFPQGIVHVYIPNIATDEIDAFVCATRIVAEFFKCTICNGDNKTVLDFTNFNTIH